MGQISMATRDELVGALAARYAASNRKELIGRILSLAGADASLREAKYLQVVRHSPRIPPQSANRSQQQQRFGRI
jgi:hypothetical protein